MSKSVAASALKRSAPRPRKRGRQKSPHLSAALTAPRLRTLHRAADIGNVLKGGVNVCQQQLVNELLGPLVTEFVRNFSREDATPYQRGSNGSLLGRIQAVKFIRHNTSCIFRAAHIGRGSPVARTRFKVLIYLKRFGAGACLASTNKSLALKNKSPAGSERLLACTHKSMTLIDVRLALTSGAKADVS